MLLTFQEGLKSFKYLLNFKNYRRSEIFIKILILIPVLPFFTWLFLFTSLFYLIERMLSPIFKFFIYFQLRMIQKRNYAGKWMLRIIGIINLLVTFMLLPFISAYYLTMLLKMLFKYWMRVLILKLDFSIQFSISTLKIFDDYGRQTGINFSTLMKDAPQTQALNKALESYFEDVELEDENSEKRS